MQTGLVRTIRIDRNDSDRIPTMLDDRIKSRILDDHKKLTADGKLLSRSQLEGFYRTFRSRFGPDLLAKLDGEELLETMHAHGNRDSLVYWLEFKNDEEFPAHFGSISGGSAFKFGIFRGKETGTWVTGSPNAVKELTVPEAVEIARKHRDQLIQGVETIGKLPDLADDAEYRKLQEDLGEDSPVSQRHRLGSQVLQPDRTPRGSTTTTTPISSGSTSSRCSRCPRRERGVTCAPVGTLPPLTNSASRSTT